MFQDKIKINNSRDYFYNSKPKSISIFKFLKKNKEKAVIVFQWLTIPIVLYVLYYQLFIANDFYAAIELFKNGINKKSIIFLLLSLLLMPINLGTEAKKWQLLLHKHFPISFSESFRSILTGISVSIFTPKRIGEYAGRILVLKSNRKQAVSSLFVGNFSQSIANILLGLISVFLFLTKFEYSLPYSEFFLKLSLILVVILVLLLLYTYYNLDKVAKVLTKFSFIRNNKEFIAAFYLYSNRLLTIFLSFSMLKYLIFITQFVLIIKAFGIAITLFWGIICASGVFFIKTLLPVPSSIELAARGTIAIAFFGFFTENDFGILVASILLWVINLAIPALIGSLLITKAKIKI